MIFITKLSLLVNAYQPLKARYSIIMLLSATYKAKFSSFTNKFNTLISKLCEVENSVSSFSKVTLNTPSSSLNVNSNGHASSSYTSISPCERHSSSVPRTYGKLVSLKAIAIIVLLLPGPPVTSRAPPPHKSVHY